MTSVLNAQQIKASSLDLEEGLFLFFFLVMHQVHKEQLQSVWLD